VNIKTVLKNEFLSPFLPLSGFDITLYCQDLQSLQKHKEIQSTKEDNTFSSPKEGTGVVSCHNRTVVIVYFTFKGVVENINVRGRSQPRETCLIS